MGRSKESKMQPTETLKTKCFCDSLLLSAMNILTKNLNFGFDVYINRKWAFKSFFVIEAFNEFKKLIKSNEWNYQNETVGTFEWKPKMSPFECE